ncbi:con-Ins Im1-like [Lineus longissimus]|uniref:con-Ins Im1-like n=1 Tax=Lineus longissimus TaxID=88925 RepID=UPI002B4C5BA5
MMNSVISKMAENILAAIPMFMLVFLLTNDKSTADDGHMKVCTEDIMERGPVDGGQCGHQLANLVDNICYPHGVYYAAGDLFMMKRLSKNGGISALSYNPFMPSNKANSYLKEKRMAQTGVSGIVCECCYHKCSHQEFHQYCNLPAKRGYGNDAMDSTLARVSRIRNLPSIKGNGHHGVTNDKAGRIPKSYRAKDDRLLARRIFRLLRGDIEERKQFSRQVIKSIE